MRVSFWCISLQRNICVGWTGRTTVTRGSLLECFVMSTSSCVKTPDTHLVLLGCRREAVAGPGTGRNLHSVRGKGTGWSLRSSSFFQLFLKHPLPHFLRAQARVFQMSSLGPPRGQQIMVPDGLGENCPKECCWRERGPQVRTSTGPVMEEVTWGEPGSLNHITRETTLTWKPVSSQLSPFK